MTAYFNVRYFDKARNKWCVSTYKMNEATARERFAGTDWQVIEPTREERRGVAQTLGHFYRNQHGK